MKKSGMKVRLRKGLAMGHSFFRGDAPPNAYEGEKMYKKSKPKAKKKKKLTKRYYA